MKYAGRILKPMIFTAVCVICAGICASPVKAAQADDPRTNESAIGTVKIIEDEPVPVSGNIQMASSVSEAKGNVLGANRDTRQSNIFWYPVPVLMLIGGGVLRAVKK